MVSSIDVKALNIFINQPVSQNMIHKLVVTTLQVLPCSEDKDSRTAHNGKPLPSLMTFINKLVRYTNVYTGTLMTTLVYLDRLKHKLPKNAQGLPCTRHRIFLSCLILASKFHNDCSPKNIHWANYTDGLFSLKDVNLMERQLLYLLNWGMRVSNEEMCAQLASFLSPIKEDLIKSSKMRKYLAKQQAAAASASTTTTSTKNCSRTSSLSPSPTISRSSSAASQLSLHNPHHSRQASTNSVMSHYRQDSCSSLESLSPVMPVDKVRGYNDRNAYEVDPRIEMMARNEEQELSRMISQIYKQGA
ncbi:hypothetical protein FDK38_000771 [Candidozyma auris]|nr:hypothetical protein FDK38_000771 [[Candida] auris]